MRRIIASPLKKALNAAMEKSALANDLIQFLTTENACIETLACLSPKAELEIRVAQTLQISVKHDGEKVVALEKAATSPDFIFDAAPDAIAVLIAEKDLSPAQLGVRFIKQLVNRDIKVSMPSSVFQITRRGYLNIIKVGGMELLTELKKHNLASLPKITAALKKLRNKS